MTATSRVGSLKPEPSDVTPLNHGVSGTSSLSIAEDDLREDAPNPLTRA
jgi:hypothetical protein